MITVSGFPKLYVFETPDEPEYWLVNSGDEEALMAATLIRERAMHNVYYKPCEPSYFTQYQDITDEQLATLPEMFREKVERERRANERMRAEYEEEVFEWEAIQQVVEAESAEEAAKLTTTVAGRERRTVFFVLESRANWQYEGYEVARYRTIK